MTTNDPTAFPSDGNSHLPALGSHLTDTNLFPGGTARPISKSGPPLFCGMTMPAYTHQPYLCQTTFQVKVQGIKQQQRRESEVAVVDRDREITNRSELIAWLTEAAELEQLLMLQYLFAAYSLKKTTTEGITAAETELTRRWESLMLHVARQEMAHLAMVSNLLLAVGGKPHFTRPNMPQPALAYRPFPFTLQRFCDESLARFIRAEQPQPQLHLLALALVPNPPDYHYTGELYRKISAGFAYVENALVARGETLFIGPDAGQANGRWSTSVVILAVTDLRSAQAAIEEIVEEGEGAPVGSANSHWAIFTAIAAELSTARRTNPAFEPARTVADNPMTIMHPDVGSDVNLITFETARQIAGLFNTVYETTLSILMQFFDFAGETPEERNYLQGALSQTMSAIVRPLAEVLTQLPLINDSDPLRAGPGFEFYGPAFEVSTQLECRWEMLRERMRMEADGCRELAKQVGSPPRLEYMRLGLTRIGGHPERFRERCDHAEDPCSLFS